MEPQNPLLMHESNIFNALAHPMRLEILELLRDGEQCVCHIQAVLDQRQAYISQHLNVLRNAGLVKNRKEGQRVYYQASDPALFNVIDHVKSILRAQGLWRGDLAVDVLPAKPKKVCNCPQCANISAQVTA